MLGAQSLLKKNRIAVVFHDEMRTHSICTVLPMAFCAHKESGITYLISDELSEIGWFKNPKDEKNVKVKKDKGKAIPVTGSGGPCDCETSRLPHFLDNRLTDGGEIIRLTRRPPFTPSKIAGTDFC
jgi:hypothetical protein